MVAVGISGATGCIYGIRLLEALRALGQETELILSDWGAEKWIKPFINICYIFQWYFI